MKNLIAGALIIAAIGLVSCNSKSEVNSGKVDEGDVVLVSNDETTTHGTIHLTKEDFPALSIPYKKTFITFS